MLYFKYSASIAHLCQRNALATNAKTLLSSRHFHRSSTKCLVREQGKGFYLTTKCFLLNIFSRTQITEIISWAVHLSGWYGKIRTVQGTNQNAPLHHRPVQPYNKIDLNRSATSPKTLKKGHPRRPRGK